MAKLRWHFVHSSVLLCGLKIDGKGEYRRVFRLQQVGPLGTLFQVFHADLPPVMVVCHRCDYFHKFVDQFFGDPWGRGVHHFGEPLADGFQVQLILFVDFFRLGLLPLEGFQFFGSLGVKFLILVFVSSPSARICARFSIRCSNFSMV